MKKITFIFLATLFSICGYSQFTEGFENTTGPDALPSTNWTLGSGNWAVFDNSVGAVRWGISSLVTTPPAVYQGTNAAYVNRENIGISNTSEDYLSTPLVTIPLNGQLRFYTRSFATGDQGTIYQIKVAPVTAMQNDPAAYTLVQQWTEATLTTTFNIYEEKIVDLTAYGTQQVYISFVKVYTQPTASLGGDRWLVDNVTIVERCLDPTNLTFSALTPDGVSLNWDNTSGATSWEIEVVSATGTPTGTGIVYSGTLPYVHTGLLPNTAYKFYVKAICSAEYSSEWVGPSGIFTTLTLPPVCGGNFVDEAGPTENYANNSDSTVVICPTTPGELVTVTFTSFDVENNWDALYVFDGNSINAPQIASTNGPANVPGGLAGGFWGNTNPGPFTSSSADGCLTFRFRSDDFINYPGWLANVTCDPPPVCQQPTALTTTAVTSNSVSLGWVNVGNATSWQVLVLPCSEPAPNASSTGWTEVFTNTYDMSGLDSALCYNFYVRGNCGATDGVSNWSGPKTFTTLIEPPVCGGNFVDEAGPTENYANNSDSTVLICPTVPGEQVTVTFTSFETETNWDALYVFDGNSIAAPQIASDNDAGFVPGGLAGGYWGNTIPGPFTSSSADGCLTFRFRSDGWVNNPGWIANITCNPPPTCPRPTAVVVSDVTQTGATVSWTDITTPSSWQVLFLPFNAPVPDASTPGWVTANSNPFIYNGLTSGTLYKVYVRSYCSDTDISLWSNGLVFATLISNDECEFAINVPVNTDNVCTQFSSGTIIGATASTVANTCEGTSDDDVWFSFIATSTTHTVNINNIQGSTDFLIHALYSGDCNTLNQLYCSNFNLSVANSLVVGQTYYIRVYSWTATTNQNSTFDICIGSIAPPIAVSNTQYTTQQLIEDVFLNTTCASVSNITSSTGTNFGSTNGIAYFNQNNSGFPFTEGIVLTSGNAINSQGPNISILNDGEFDWTGDADLEAIILAATGNPMESKNATKLEFDFVPLIDTINFNFVFASEEYGTFQCAFSDAFAFLLTDISTGITTNLAVLPNTTTPVSVVTIRDNQFNDFCDSVNEEYFDSYYGFGGLDPYTSPTNYNGITVPLTATSTVIPGNQYHIKLVIADRLDNSYDSAVFLEGGSLDIGNFDLGEDFLQSNNTALCTGENYTITTGLNPTLYTFAWTNNGNVIANETGPTLTINQAGVYGLIIQYIGTTCTTNDSITIEYYNNFVPGTPANLNFCNNTGFAEFDLSQNNNASLGSLDPTTHSINYFVSITDAQNETNALPLLYTNTIINTQTIYVRIENTITGCFEISTFNLIVNPVTTPTFTPITICSGDTVTLPTTSLEGNIGTWNPAIVDNTQSGTYTFTPNYINPTPINLITNGDFSQGNTGFTTDYQFLNNAGLSGVQKAYGIVTAANLWFQFFPPCFSNSPSGGNMMVVDGSTSNGGNDKVWDQTVNVQPNQTYTFSYWLQTIAMPNPAEIEVTINGVSIGNLTAPSSDCQTSQYTYTWNSGNNTTAQIAIYDRIITSNGNDFSLDDISLIANVSNPCVTTATLTVTVNQPTQSTFAAIPAICSGGIAPSLPTTSLEGNSGTWNPAIVDNTQSGTYTFTPNSGLCSSVGSLTITVIQLVQPTFDAVAPICSGETLNALPTTSLEGIAGTWLPALNNTATTTYTFTPSTGQCILNATLTIVVNQNITPTFNAIDSICNGDTVPNLPSASIEGTTGTWSPAVINNTVSGTYTFTPDAGQCATNSSLAVTVFNTFDFEITESCIANNYTLEVGALNESFDITTSNFNWYNDNQQQVGTNSNTFNVTEYLNSTQVNEELPISFSVTVTNADGCSQSKSITLVSISCGIQKGISANNDGKNDFFDLTQFDVKNLSIFNRHGVKAYSKNQYSNEWIGQSDNGDELPDGTYYYVIEFNNNDAAKTGWIYINRAQ